MTPLNVVTTATRALVRPWISKGKPSNIRNFVTLSLDYLSHLSLYPFLTKLECTLKLSKIASSLWRSHFPAIFPQQCGELLKVDDYLKIKTDLCFSFSNVFQWLNSCFYYFSCIQWQPLHFNWYPRAAIWVAWISNAWQTIFSVLKTQF